MFGCYKEGDEMAFVDVYGEFFPNIREQKKHKDLV